MDRDDAIDWRMLTRKWEDRSAMLRAALIEIDALGNGIDTAAKVDGLTAYALLMRCGSIARKALNENG